MPPRSYYRPDDFKHIQNLLVHDYGVEAAIEFDDYDELDVAPLLDKGSLPAILRMQSDRVDKIIRYKTRHYRVFEIPKRRGGVRQIESPRTYLKVIQWWILDNILNRIHFDECVQGFVKGRGPYSNAIHHHGAKHVLNMDLKDFFPSVRKRDVALGFRELGYPDEVVGQLAELCTFHGRLPQGAPTSPALANLAATEMDDRIQLYCSNREFKYTRYADDLTVSGTKAILPNDIGVLKRIVKSHGFEVNPTKTRVRGRGGRMEVTGFVINDSVRMPKVWRKRVRSIFHEASFAPEDYIDQLPRLDGLLACILGTEPESKLVRSGIAAVNNVRQALAIKGYE